MDKFTMNLQCILGIWQSSGNGDTIFVGANIRLMTNRRSTPQEHSVFGPNDDDDDGDAADD